MRRLSILAPLAILVATGACATGGGGSAGSSTVITMEQLEENRDLSAYEVVRRLKPQWLRVRGGQTGMAGGTVARNTGTEANPADQRATPGVIQDGVPVSNNVGYLENVSAGDLQEIRFLDARQATTRYGTGYQYGAIEIITRR